MAILMFLSSCANQNNTDWSIVLPMATGGGILPALIGVAMNEAMRSEDELVLTKPSAWPNICTQIIEGNGAARASVAWHFRNGWEPFSTDPIEAYKWFTLASNSGYSDADQYRAILADEMSAEQIAAAKHRANTWSAESETCEFSANSTDVQTAE